MNARPNARQRPTRSRSAPTDAQEKLLAAAVKALQATRLPPPRLAIVLGSGFGGVLSTVRSEVELPYATVPGFTPASVAGHPGKLVHGWLAGTPVCLLAGRAHFYEGHDLATVTFPIRVLARWGVKEILLTNAAGGINRRFRPGDFMLLTDHINFMGANPLRGARSASGPAFVDLSAVYDAGLAARLRAAARAAKLRLRRGVYLAVSGPSYETPAEIRAFARLGADAVGMSTAPEAIVARHCGLCVAGLSCITNLAAGRTRQPISHAEVMVVAAQTRDRAARLLAEFARRQPGAQNSPARQLM
jgi:purine-nucleoside phosphorylase